MYPETSVDVNVVFPMVAGFEILTTMNLKTVVEQGSFCLEDEIAGPSETLVNCQTIRLLGAENGNLIAVAL
jgi:hypothetical protein